MRCLFCAVELAPLRALVDGEYCCDAHRQLQQRKQQTSERESVRQLPTGDLTPLEFQLHPIPAPGFSAAHIAVPIIPRADCIRSQEADQGAVEGFIGGFLAGCNQLFDLGEPRVSSPGVAVQQSGPAVHYAFDLKPHLPVWSVDPEYFDLYALAESSQSASAAESVVPEIPRPLAGPAQQAAMLWKSVLGVWKHAPSDLRLLTLVLPVLVILAFSPSLPKVQVGVSPNTGLPRAITGEWATFMQGISDRAAVEYTDDFRSGLDDWQGRDNAAVDWSYDAAGFVRPGALALYRPTLPMSDYRFEFLGEIDQKGLGCAVRAADPFNFYAVRLTVVKPGPLPEIRLVRYPVIGGKEGPKVERPLPVLARNDTLFRILLDVRGDDFTIMTQGKVVDSWSDSRLKKGGVGLFCARGEKARVRWVEVTHQYDVLGRLCAYLAPGGLSKAGNWN